MAVFFYKDSLKVYFLRKNNVYTNVIINCDIKTNQDDSL